MILYFYQIILQKKEEDTDRGFLEKLDPEDNTREQEDWLVYSLWKK